MKPAIRNRVYAAFWRYAAERQRIFHRRLRGEAAPWTTDSILETYKFCNVYRATDRVSQYLIRQVIYSDEMTGLPAEDVFLRVILFRLFSKPSTWQYLEKATGGLRRRTLDIQMIGDGLEALRQVQPIYTSAFILCAHDAYGHDRKHRNHLALVSEMFKPGRLGRSLAKAKSLREVYGALSRWPMLGPFMSYQLAVDLNYTAHLDFSEDDFTMPGPGALRGIRKVFSDLGDRRPADIIMSMVDLQEVEFDRFGLEWSNLFGRRLHAIDVQGLFCEVDKYSRVAFPDLTSNRVRIKHRFAPSTEPLAIYFPPKWGLDEPITRLHGPNSLRSGAPSTGGPN